MLLPQYLYFQSLKTLSMMTEQFHLSWKEHGLNTARTLHSLRDDDQLCDITIACKEGVFLGHKVVLFASSLLFRNILRKHTHPHPLIYLKNITDRDMASLLDFMYFGEVKLEKEQLASFSAAAEELQVLGLTSGSSSSHVKDLPRKCFAAEQSQEVLPASSAQPVDPWKVPIDEILQASTDNQTYRASKPLLDTQNINFKSNIKFESVLETSRLEIQPAIETTEFDIQKHPKLADASVETVKLKESPQRVSISGQGLINKSQSVAFNGSPGGIKDYKDLQNYIIKGERVSLEGRCRRRYECVICGTASVNKGHLLAHIEGKHFHRVLKYTCNRCGRSQGNRASAKSHMKRCEASSASQNRL